MAAEKPKWNLETYGDLLPPLADNEKDKLYSSIAKYGVRDSVIVDREWNVLDGAHRIRAAESLGKPIPHKFIDEIDSAVVTSAEKKAFIYRENEGHRNLSPAQKKEMQIAKKKVAHDLRNQDAKKYTQEVVSKILGVVQATVSNWFSGHNINLDIASTPDARVTIPRKAYPEIIQQVKEKTHAEVASNFGVAPKTIQRIVKKVEEQSKLNDSRKEPPALTSGGLPSTGVEIIVTDPPWRYEHQTTDSRRIEEKYPTMTLEDICKLPVQEIMAKDCVVFMWTTSPKLEESFQVLKAWGLSYRTCAIWDKEIIGMGYYFRQQHELVLVATQGNPTPPEESVRPASIFCSRRERHSKKPDLFYDIVEKMYPTAHKLEMFARAPRIGWFIWGNEVPA